MKKFNLPVSYQMCGTVPILANSLEEAIEKFNNNIDKIALPNDSVYVDSSFELSSKNLDEIEAMTRVDEVKLYSFFMFDVKKILRDNDITKKDISSIQVLDDCNGQLFCVCKEKGEYWGNLLQKAYVEMDNLELYHMYVFNCDISEDDYFKETGKQIDIYITSNLDEIIKR